MRANQSSFTAATVAAARSLGAKLPVDARIADDPYGARFADGIMSLAPALPMNPLLMPFVLYMQVRTRRIDDALRAHVKDALAHGRAPQVVLLGAGFDCRAARFRAELEHARGVLFEIDHPATQKKKRDVLAGVAQADVRYLPWNFEERPAAELSSALDALGFDRKRPSLTIWEGVTMYLTERAIDATVRAVADYACATSTFVVTYFDAKLLTNKPSALQRLVQTVVRRAGEPFTFGWDVDAFAPWFHERGFDVVDDDSALGHSAALLPAHIASKLDELARFRRIAELRRI